MTDLDRFLRFASISVSNSTYRGLGTIDTAAPLDWILLVSRKRSAVGANYYYGREKGIAFHDAGYW